MIFGADWLEDNSPMWFYWKKKLMRLTHNNIRILLKGIRDETITCTQVPTHKLKGMSPQKESSNSLSASVVLSPF